MKKILTLSLLFNFILFIALLCFFYYFKNINTEKEYFSSTQLNSKKQEEVNLILDNAGQDTISFTYIIDEFSKIDTVEQYKEYNKIYAKWLVFIYAIKKSDIILWDKIFSFEYESAKETLPLKYQGDLYKKEISQLYELIRSDNLEYKPGMDISAVMGKEQDIVKIQKNIQQESRNNRISLESYMSYYYMYRATKENKFCERITFYKESYIPLCNQLIND